MHVKQLTSDDLEFMVLVLKETLNISGHTKSQDTQSHLQLNFLDK